MTGKKLLRVSVLTFFTLILAASSISGFMNAPFELMEESSIPGIVVQLLALTYAITALPAIYGLWGKRNWTFIVLVIWGASTVLAAALAARFYGESSWTVSAVAGVSISVVIIPMLIYTRHFSRSEDESA